MAAEGCSYADEGEEVFGLAFVAAVESAAAGYAGIAASGLMESRARAVPALDCHARFYCLGAMVRAARQKRRGEPGKGLSGAEVVRGA